MYHHVSPPVEVRTFSLSKARLDLVRQRALEGAADVLRRGDVLTFANVSKAAGVPERTLYRHFPSREALLSAIFEWANERIGFRGDLPEDAGRLKIHLLAANQPGRTRISAEALWWGV